MKYIFTLLFAFAAALGIKAQSASQTDDSLEHEVLLETTQGNIRLKLYNDTPLHRDNFLKLVRSGFYDGLLFHRVIPNFMIQAGDSASRHSPVSCWAIRPSPILCLPRYASRNISTEAEPWQQLVRARM